MPSPPLGVVLAGGRALRLPGKPLLELHGRALISYPLAALDAVLPEVVVLAKAPVPGFATLLEPAEPVHPVCGIRHALSVSGGRAVLVCAADMPAINPAELLAILAARTPGAAAVIPRAQGRLQPLCALYEQSAREDFERATGEEPMAELALRLEPRIIDRSAAPYENINTPSELARSAPRIGR